MDRNPVGPSGDDDVRDDVIVTPEGVPLDFVPAGLASRAAALALDAIIVYAILTTAFAAIGFAASAGLPATVVAIGVAFIGGSAAIGYPIVLETWWNGRTVGKAAAGLRVVSTGGGPIGFRQAALRGALLLVDGLVIPIGLVGVTSVVLSRRCQRLGDVAAGTMVVRDRRDSLTHARPVAFLPPRGWEAYAANLDVGRLDADLYRTVRAFLLRAPALTPQARSTVGIAVAECVVARLPNRPPPGTLPEVFLQCVAAAYQMRFRRAGPGPWLAPPGMGPAGMVAAMAPGIGPGVRPGTR